MIKIKGDVDKWECVYKQCKAKCCSPAKVTIGDLKRISDKLGLRPEEFSETKDEGGLFQLKSKNGSCHFLHDDYKCELHKRKVVPLACRMFPFLFDGITYSDDIIVTIKLSEDCPGYGMGEKLGEEFILEIEKKGSKFVHEITRYLRSKQKGESFKDAFNRFE